MHRPLSSYFKGIGAKRLSDVEVKADVSNQHELNGITGFKEILGSEKCNFDGHFIYVSDNEEQFTDSTGMCTWYDARANHPTRTEYRLYYTANPVIEAAAPGDLMIIGKIDAKRLAVIIAPQGSTSEQQLLWLFGLNEVGSRFVVKNLSEDQTELNYAGRYILETLGFEIPETSPDYLDDLLDRFSNKFPTTSDFSKYSRSTVQNVSAIEEPDKTLMTWLEQEEILFRTLEKYIVQERLKEGFGPEGTDVDEFIAFSLSVQNRRKSRAGFAFENHLTEIFTLNKISFARGQRTERNNKPDFLFPGARQYHDAGYSPELLTMLGVKTTAKDRWRQVLSEADRINFKHLITLEPAISKNQTDEMKAQNLQLVLPEPLVHTYTVAQQPELMTLYEFIKLVREKQTRS